MINSLLIPILKDIDFSDRFKKTSKKHNNYENKLTDENFQDIEYIVQSVNNKFKFIKTENFFKLVEKINDFKIQFNIVVQRGTVEFIWGIEKKGERLKMGGSICGV